MAEDNAIRIVQGQIDESRDWIKFALSEYFKWNAAFLAGNIAALAFASQTKQARLIAGMFLVTDIVAAFLPFLLLNWTRKIGRIVDARRDELSALAGVRLEGSIHFPILPLDFGLIISGIGQIVGSAVWAWLLGFGHLV